MWVRSSALATSEAGDRGTPWERANFTGFSIQPLTVLVMASISIAVMTTDNGLIEEGDDGQDR